MSTSTAGETAWERHGSGPPVVLIHGFGLNRAMWQWQLPALTPQFSVLTYDLLGHGESAPPAGTPCLAMFSRQLLGLMDRCGIERAAIVGFSLGGMIARRAALDHPDRLSALAILNSPHDRSPAEREAVRARVRQTETDGPAANVEPALERWFTPAFRAEAPETVALVRRWIARNDPALYPQIYRVLAEGDAEIANGLERIACPALVMTGEDDPGNTPAMARVMAGLIPGARLAILPGLRHMALAEAPETVNAPLCAFLRDATIRLQESVHGSGTVAPRQPGC
ncbi:MAG: alpha/beta fold hydrolase [Rhodospirillaceae bacterium]|nr:alpha/beta fold hydrolase [Rhodospirillaceae bacterium]